MSSKVKASELDFYPTYGSHNNVSLPKYSDPKNRWNTWSGRGVCPKWLKNYLDDGYALEDFLLKKSQKDK